MNPDAAYPLQALWNLAAAPMQVQALQQALKRRLFAHLTQPMSAAAVAQLLQCNSDIGAIWLDMLWSMGLLHRHAGMENHAPEYVATGMAARFFCQTSAQDCAAAWQARAEFLAGFSAQWEPLLREGLAAPDAPQGGVQQQRWAQAARGHLGQEQRAVSAQAVLSLLERLPPLPEAGRFADVGGGPGHVAVAQESIHAAGLEQRLSGKACDLNHEDIGSGYDLIWCSSVLHFLQDAQAAVQAMCAALKPGGRVLLAHAELSDDPAQAAQVLPFYAGVMLCGGRLPRSGEVPRWMRAAGCTGIRALGRIPWALAPLWVYTGRCA